MTLFNLRGRCAAIVLMMAIAGSALGVQSSAKRPRLPADIEQPALAVVYGLNPNQVPAVNAVHWEDKEWLTLCRDAPNHEVACLTDEYTLQNRKLNGVFQSLQIRDAHKNGRPNPALFAAQKLWGAHRQTCDAINSATDALRCKIKATITRRSQMEDLMDATH